MAPVMTRRSWRELSARKARTLLTIATIAAAVTGLWLFAVPPLIDGAMDDRVERDLLWDIRLSPDGVALNEADITAIRELPNVAGVEARVTARSPMRVGGQETQVWLIGVDDFIDQEVNAVHISEGVAPRAGEVLTDVQNARTGRYDGGIGDQLVLGTFPVRVSGVGSTLVFSATVDDDDPVFYLPLDRLQAAMNFDRITWLDLRLDHHDPTSVAVTADAVRSYLRTIDPDLTYWDVLQVRQPGDWPEKESFDNVIRLTYIVAALGLASALLMVYTTMNTIVREQTREIGIIKAVGGTRKAIVRSYLRTAGVLGALGTMIGVVLGVLLSNLLVGFAARQFSGVEPAFGVPWWVLALSLVVGLGGTMLAAMPAVRQATAMPVHEALTGEGLSGSFGSGVMDGALRRARFLPRTVGLGFRNAVRRKGRSLATIAQVGFAVGTVLGFLGLGITVLDVTAKSADGEGGDIWVRGAGDATAALADVPGVADVVPVFYSAAAVGDDGFTIHGQTPGAAAFHDDLDAGRWFTAAEEAGAERVAVLGPAVAKSTGAGIGDAITVETVTGRSTLEVVGLDTLMVDDGEAIYTPLSTATELGGGGIPSNYFVLTTDTDDAFVDAVAAEIQEVLRTERLGGTTEVRYVEREAELSQSRTIIGILMIVGVPVIAIGMIGLVNTMITNILERTREIGILRSIGARARHLRRMIRAEALLLGFLGWIAAIPIGFAIGTLLTELLSDGFGVDFTLQYPLWPLAVALLATLVITAVVVRLPVRRAVGLQPGVALRYE